MPKEHVVIFALLCIMAFGAGYWHSASKVDSDERAEVSTPSAPTVVTGSQSAVEKAIRSKLNKPTGELTKADLEKVTKLYLHSLQLIEVPEGLEKLTQLIGLSLGHNRLSDVKGLEKLTQLTRLVLANNQLTKLPVGLEKLTQLTSLSLSNNQLTDVKGLEKLTQLKVLSLVDNPDLTKAQIAELRKALPNCRIDSNPKK